MNSYHLIESDRWRLWLEPATGVQWMAAEVCHDGQWLAVVPDCRQADVATGASPSHPAEPRAGQDETSPLPAASFHMLPYSNRIKDGQFHFNGEHYQLAEGDRHAIHGALRKRAWRVSHQDGNALSCEYDSQRDGAVNWPWPLQARLHHVLEGPSLHSEITVTNTGRTAMPAGLGWHPYFVREIKGSTPRLRLPVSGLYPDATGDCLPDGAALPLPAELDFREPRMLDAGQRIDVCLAGLAGSCDIAWPGAGLALNMKSSSVCTHLVLFNPDQPHFAVEPVSNANDGFNLQARGVDAGVVTLAPGESLSASMTLTSGSSA